AAARITQRRIAELIEQKGVEFFIGALRRILTVTSEAARKKVSRLNDGVFRQPRFLDTVGPEAGLVKIGITLTKQGDRLKLSFHGSSPMMRDKPMNSFFQGILGLSMVYLCGWFFYDLPANNGLLDVLEWDFPDDTFVNAKGDAPTSLAPFPQTAFAHGMFLCGARMLYQHDPKRAVAAWYQGFGVPIFGGVNQWGEPIADITPEMNATGAGARPDMDGVNGAGAYFATMSDCSDVETTESDRPFLYLYRNYSKSSYGHGKFRGGAGVGFGMMVHQSPFLVLGAFGYGTMFPSTMGIFGGYAVPTAVVQTVTGSNVGQLLAAGGRGLPATLDEMYEQGTAETGVRRLHHVTKSIEPIANGDTFYVPVGGGAGYGDVLERDPQAVLDDLREGLTTPWAARQVYRVAYDPESLRLDPAATQALRDEARAERLRRGKPFARFEAEWAGLRPPAEVLKYYGSYPEPGAA
ncbi:MAG: hydantoinase B/oxoprolinase family protein, partial [Deferrisomatales bacterium]